MIYRLLDQPERAQEHRELHARYRPDDNARDRAATLHRRHNPAADHAAASLVIHDLQRPGAYGLPASSGEGTLVMARVTRSGLTAP